MSNELSIEELKASADLSLPPPKKKPPPRPPSEDKPRTSPPLLPPSQDRPSKDSSKERKDALAEARRLKLLRRTQSSTSEDGVQSTDRPSDSSTSPHASGIAVSDTDDFTLSAAASSSSRMNRDERRAALAEARRLKEEMRCARAQKTSSAAHGKAPISSSSGQRDEKDTEADVGVQQRQQRLADGCDGDAAALDESDDDTSKSASDGPEIHRSPPKTSSKPLPTPPTSSHQRGGGAEDTKGDEKPPPANSSSNPTGGGDALETKRREDAETQICEDGETSLDGIHVLDDDDVDQEEEEEEEEGGEGEEDDCDGEDLQTQLEAEMLSWEGMIHTDVGGSDPRRLSTTEAPTHDGDELSSLVSNLSSPRRVSRPRLSKQGKKLPPMPPVAGGGNPTGRSNRSSGSRDTVYSPILKSSGVLKAPSSPTPSPQTNKPSSAPPKKPSSAAPKRPSPAHKPSSAAPKRPSPAHKPSSTRPPQRLMGGGAPSRSTGLASAHSDPRRLPSNAPSSSNTNGNDDGGDGGFKSKIRVGGRSMTSSMSMRAREGESVMLEWCQRKACEVGVVVENFHSSWHDGLALAAVVSSYRPDLLEFSSMSPLSPVERLRSVLAALETIMGPQASLLEPEDFIIATPESELAIVTYLLALRAAIIKDLEAAHAGGRPERRGSMFVSDSAHLGTVQRPTRRARGGAASNAMGLEDKKKKEHEEEEEEEEEEESVASKLADVSAAGPRLATLRRPVNKARRPPTRGKRGVRIGATLKTTSSTARVNRSGPAEASLQFARGGAPPPSEGGGRGGGRGGSGRRGRGRGGGGRGGSGRRGRGGAVGGRRGRGGSSRGAMRGGEHGQGQGLAMEAMKMHQMRKAAGGGDDGGGLVLRPSDDDPSRLVTEHGIELPQEPLPPEWKRKLLARGNSNTHNNNGGEPLQGYAYKLEKKKWKRMWFVLKGPHFGYYTREPNTVTGTSGPQHPKGLLALDLVTAVEPYGEKPNAVALMDAEGDSLIFHTETPEECQVWMDALRMANAQYIGRRESVSSPTSPMAHIHARPSAGGGGGGGVAGRPGNPMVHAKRARAPLPIGTLRTSTFAPDSAKKSWSRIASASREGILMRKTATKKWVVFFFLAKGGFLIQCKAKTKKEMQRHPLMNCTFQEYESKSKEFAFLLTAGGKKLILATKTLEDMHAWMNAILKQKASIESAMEAMAT